MVAEILAQYSFAPWFRRGLAAEITDPDDLGEHPDAGPSARAALPIELSLGYVPAGGGAEVPGGTVGKSVQIVGPGDVLGLKREAILRTEPRDGELAFSPSELVAVELYEEDLPWRYTPAGPAAGRRFKLRPWLALWVLEDGEIASITPAAPPLPERLELVAGAAAVLPPPAETWAWAHVQIARAIAHPDEVPAAIADAPDLALARLLCPRRLRHGAAYHAVLVPAFETGRLAGLGEPVGGVPAQKPAWGAAQATRPNQTPVYFRWRFRTGDDGDFEDLVRALVPRPAGGSFGKRAMSIAELGFGLDGVASASTIELEGALQAPGATRTAFPAATGAAFTGALGSLLDLAAGLQDATPPALANPYHDAAGGAQAYGASLPDDPIVVPPIYAGHHAGVTRVADAGSSADLAWLRELNLDPRNRAAAGLGSQAVQARQDELVERAWQQVGELAKVNDRLRVAELALGTGQAVFDKHLATASSDRTITLTEALQRGIAGSAGRSVFGEIRDSRVPLAAQSPAFRKVSRPQRKVNAVVGGGSTTAALQTHLIGRLDQPPGVALSAAGPLADPLAAVELASVSAVVSGAIGELASKAATEPKQIFLTMVVDALRAGAQPGQPLQLPTAAALVATLNASATLGTLDAVTQARVKDLIAAIRTVANDGGRAATVTLRSAAFAGEYGDEIAGKSMAGVTLVPDAPPAAGVARAISVDSAAQFATDLAAFNAELVAGRPIPEPRPALGDAATFAGGIRAAIAPRTSVTARIARSLDGLPAPRQTPRPLAPIQAYPVFDDATFNDLRRLGQDFVIPGFDDIPPNTLMLLEPNDRFIQSFLAGMNHDLARELLWREYPTDLRGSYFRRFWDTRDASAAQAEDIKALDAWKGALGAQSARAGGIVVLVIRGELLRKYPSTVVYAQRARFAAGTGQPRELEAETPANLRFPVLQAELEPDLALFGFTLTADEARGRRPGDPGTGGIDRTAPPFGGAAGRGAPTADPGWFFVLKERPGQVRFGLDEPGAAPPPLDSWDDLSWGHLAFAGGAVNVGIAANPLVLTGHGTADQPTVGTWGQSAADMAYILFQDPVLYARHAAELLP